MSDTHTRFDVYRAVTDTIIAAIEAGAGNFVMPWHGPGAAVGRPENAYTRMEYHGVNVISLWAQSCLRGFESGHWASYKQWQQAGAQVRLGERGTTIVFFKRLGEDTEEAESEGGAPTRARLVARASRVFNAAQVEGWNPPDAPVRGDVIELSNTADAFIGATGATIEHGGARAYYSVPDDRICIPDRDRFTGTDTSSPTEAYYATLLHELVHWTGAGHRLDRKLGSMGRSELAAEELIAEIGAAFLCADLRISNAPRPDHAAYVANWLQLLRDDTRAVFTASRLASAAATYLHDLVAYGL